MANQPDIENWFTTFSLVISYLPVFIRAIPLIFQVIGLIGTIWYLFSIIRYNTVKYQLPGLFKSVIVLIIGLLMEYFLPYS